MGIDVRRLEPPVRARERARSPARSPPARGCTSSREGSRRAPEAKRRPEAPPPGPRPAADRGRRHAVTDLGVLAEGSGAAAGCIEQDPRERPGGSGGRRKSPATGRTSRIPSRRGSPRPAEARRRTVESDRGRRAPGRRPRRRTSRREQRPDPRAARRAGRREREAWDPTSWMVKWPASKSGERSGLPASTVSPSGESGDSAVRISSDASAAARSSRLGRRGLTIRSSPRTRCPPRGCIASSLPRNARAIARRGIERMREPRRERLAPSGAARPQGEREGGAATPAGRR